MAETTNTTPPLTDEQRASEVIRLSSIFSRGCGNTVVSDPPAAPETCDECRTDFLRRIENVVAGRPHGEGIDDAALAEEG